MKHIEKIKKCCDLFGIAVPIIQGGMAHISDSDMAEAVSLAGGLGVIASGGEDSEYLKDQIIRYKKKSNRPFGVNIALKSKNIDEIIDVILQENVPVVITGAGNPEKYIEKIKQNGSKCVPVVSSVALAKRVEKFGADAVIVEGCESGGHVGSVTTMCLVPQVVDAVNIPVIAAGGIADGRGIAAAYMLGACGVQVGTRFIVMQECRVDEYYKQMILKSKDISTIVLNTTNPERDDIRALKSTKSNNYFRKEINNISTNGLLENSLLAATKGDKENGLFMAGQISGLIKEEKTCKELIDEMWIQALENMGIRNE